MNIVMIGFRGSGKSTVGRALAERLEWSFIDTDVLIEQRTEMTIRDIIIDCDEDAFRELECQIVAEVAQRDNCVIGTGGGVVLVPHNIDALKETGRLIYLTASPDVLLQRILQDAHRAATRLQIDPDAGAQQIREAIAARDPLYRAAADCVINTENLTVPEIVEQIMAEEIIAEPMAD